MSDHKGSACRKCGQTIYWHRAKSGKNYPTDSATDRSAFHNCVPTDRTRVHCDPPVKPPQHEASPTGSQAAHSSQLEITLEERVQALETSVERLSRAFSDLYQRLPISNQDVPF